MATKKAAIASATIDPKDIKPGMTIRVHQTIKELTPKGEEKSRTQIYEGLVILRKHNKETGATITVKKISDGILVEKIFPLNLPSITKIELVKQAMVNKAKLYFTRTYKKRIKDISEKKMTSPKGTKPGEAKKKTKKTK